MNLTTNERSPLFLSFAFLVLALTVIGCGEPPIPVGTLTGTLEAGGEPLGDVQLIVLSMDTGQGGSTIVGSDGSYTFNEGIPVGNYVAYLAPAPVASADAEQPAEVSMNTEIPDKYWNESTSDLKIEIKEGENRVGLVIE